MTLMAQAQHFAGPPHWTWYIVPYFFLAGLSGGCYALATLLRLRGERWDEPAARLGYYAAFATFVPCPVLLTLDLTQPLRFWHMLWNTTPGAQGFNFRYWSPMSVDTWTLGGLFLASALSGSAALLLLLTRYRAEARPSAGAFDIAERLFTLLELVLLVLFALTLASAGTFDEAFGFPWILLWLVALAGLVPGLRGLFTARLAVTPEGAVVAQSARAVVAMPALVLAGVEVEALAAQEPHQRHAEAPGQVDGEARRRRHGADHGDAGDQGLLQDLVARAAADHEQVVVERQAAVQHRPADQLVDRV